MALCYLSAFSTLLNSIAGGRNTTIMKSVNLTLNEMHFVNEGGECIYQKHADTHTFSFPL